MEKGKIHKAWFMMAACFTLMASLGTITLLSFLTRPVSEALGFSRAAFTTYASIAGLMIIVAMPFWSKMLPKIGVRAMVAISGGLSGIAYISMSYFTTLMPFYVAGAVLGFAIPACSMLPTSVIITNWFVEKKGLAMGIAMSFTGVIVAVTAPFIAPLIQRSGWQSAYMAIGIAVLILTIPVAMFLTIHPSQVGLKAYGAKDDAPSASASTLPGVSSSVAQKSAAFWLVLTAIFLGNAAGVGFIYHIPAHLVASKGFSPAAVGSFMSLCMLILIGTKVVLGWVNDRVGTVNASLITIFGGALALFLFIFMKQGEAVISVIGISLLILYTFAYAFYTVFPPLITGTMFGLKNFASLYGLLVVAASLGVAAGNPLYGMSFDKTGSYNLMLYVGIILMGITAVLVPIAIKLSAKLPRD
ncbi:MAG: MFS transporter [Syntrophales bacterium]|nr:MFS transporter [Syntrophales bacterium]